MEVLKDWGCDLDCGWDVEVVRLLDEAGIELEMTIRKQVNVSKQHVHHLRESYSEKKLSDHTQHRSSNSDENGYLNYAKRSDWHLSDDVDGSGSIIRGDRLWYRWDWELEVSSLGDPRDST